MRLGIPLQVRDRSALADEIIHDDVSRSFLDGTVEERRMGDTRPAARPGMSCSIRLYDVRVSYRERDLLGRDMTIEEVQYVTEMVRRIAAILLLTDRLDENYRSVCANTYPWPQN